MKTLNNNDTTSFHLQLLSKIMDMNEYPFINLIIENDITYKEFEELMHLLQKLDAQYNIQKEEGFLDFTSLLVQFAGMLTEKLDPNNTIYALKKEGYFPSLITAFTSIIEYEEIRGKRR
ncbi:hypothetical protein J2Z83_001082 [Virgibacillus natechei]|uniref:DUF1878 family protein n=1 Tax=Virgibacillus natechei TaxID=1216297 RepID=A0ABS4IG24_9BACI|nr:DUF1878 family protein [Virgibacillus natechei]MBP1968979.1 hypothetical protein [Virgibacillus natechei]UZD14256.1 YhaI family protein [Virgibacillus natechei]